MRQAGNTIQYRSTKRGDSMDKGRRGEMMEAYTSADTRMATGL